MYKRQGQPELIERQPIGPQPRAGIARHVLWTAGNEGNEGCLLYTSDAADERSSVDLGGRRIIKKKKDTDLSGVQRIECKKSMTSRQV